jgi:hypothetical protein
VELDELCGEWESKVLLIRFFVLSNPPTHGVEVAMFVVEKFALSLVDFYYCMQNIQACSGLFKQVQHNRTLFDARCNMLAMLVMCDFARFWLRLNRP